MHRHTRKRPALLLVAALTIVVSTQLAYAKCPTGRITVTGDLLGQPLEITVPEIIRSFNVWNGPGVSVNGDPVHLDPERQNGNFIDWPSGPVAADALHGDTFSVAFFCTIDDAGESRKMYEIDYLFDSHQDGGYIHLPGPGDPRYRDNTSTIVHDVEGNWYRSSAAWEQLVRPMISSDTQDARH